MSVKSQGIFDFLMSGNPVIKKYDENRDTVNPSFLNHLDKSKFELSGGLKNRG